MAAELLEEYENTFSDLTFAIAQKIAEIAAAESEVTEAEGALQLKSIAAKESVKERVRGHDTELKNLKRDLRKAKTTFGSVADREALLAGATTDDVESMDHRTRLLHDVEMAESTSGVIDEMQENVRAGIELGKNAANNLAAQRSTLDRALDRVRNIKESLTSAKKTMNLMWRRMLENKLILGGIIFLLIALIGLVVYVKYFAGGSSSPPSPSGPSPAPPMTAPPTTPPPTPTPVPTPGTTTAR